MQEQPYLSLVIPAYNEEQRLLRFLPGLVAWFTTRKQPFEIIIVDDGSKDATAKVAQEFTGKFPMVRVFTYKPNRGKGNAVRTGMLTAAGRYVLFADADQSTPIEELDKLLPKIERDGYDIAIGSRQIAGANIEEAQAWYRALAGKLFGLGVKVLCVYGLADTQCGFKLMKREAAQKIFPQVTTDSAIFDVEMLVVATREGYRVAEVPVKWIHDPDTRLPYNLSRALRVWIELFRIHRVQRICWPLKIRT